MSRCLPTPNDFALYLHGNICHGHRSWCPGSPQVCCRLLVVGSLLPWLVPLVGTPNKDASKNREGGGSSALGGRRLVLRHNNQPIVCSSNRRGRMIERMRGQGWVYRGGCFFLFRGGELNDEKNYKNKIRRRPQMAAIQYFVTQQQTKNMRAWWRGDGIGRATVRGR